MKMIPRQIKPENITFSQVQRGVQHGDLSVDLQGGVCDGGMAFRWGIQRTGNCTLDNVLLQICPGGWASFNGDLSSSGNNDSWGIAFHLYQANAMPIWSSGWFWSPTIAHQFWAFDFQYPANLSGTIAFANFSSHC
jgi:hypothetical protein